MNPHLVAGAEVMNPHLLFLFFVLITLSPSSFYLSFAFSPHDDVVIPHNLPPEEVRYASRNADSACPFLPSRQYKKGHAESAFRDACRTSPVPIVHLLSVPPPPTPFHLPSLIWLFPLSLPAHLSSAPPPPPPNAISTV